MNTNEVKQVLAMMVSVYTKKLMPDINEFTVSIWQKLLADINFTDVQTSLITWMSTEKYPPTPADIRSIISTAEMGGTDQADEAWGKLKQAIRKFGHMDSEEAIQTLPELAQIIVKRFTWSYYCMMPIDEVSTYYAQFRNAYECEYRKQRERKQIPEELQKALQKIGQGNVKQIED
jgi:hypothetical protein